MSKQMNTPATTLADIKPLVKKLHLSRMMERLEELYADPSVQDLTPMEIIHDVLTAEVDRRTENALKRRLKDAHIRHQDACLGNIDFETPRGLDKAKIMQLGNCDWIRNHQNCIITGKTGCGKTFLAGAIANAACRQGLTVRFVRVPRFLKEFSAQHQVDRGFERELRALRRIDLLILDDWGIGQIDAINRSDLLEIIEDRCGVGSILVTSVLTVKAWAGYIKDPTYSDSILDRLVRNAFRINMNGESMRGQTRYGAVPVEENTEK